MSQFDRSELVSLAESCYQNDVFRDVIDYMKEVIKMGTPLNFYERILTFDSYSLLIKPFFNNFYSWQNSNLNDKLRTELQTKARTAINRICDEAIQLLDSYWVKRDDSNEAVTHYKCFKAIAYHYKAFVASGEDKEHLISKALELYEEASKFAAENLNPAHPDRLLIAYNFSHFYYEVLNSVDKALAISREAYEKGQPCFSELSKDLKYHAEKFLKWLSELIDN